MQFCSYFSALGAILQASLDSKNDESGQGQIEIFGTRDTSVLGIIGEYFL